MYCTVLYCTVLYCTVLYYTVLYYTVLYCTVLYCTVLYYTVQKVILIIFTSITIAHHFQWEKVKALCKRVHEFQGGNRKDFLDQISAAQTD